MINVYFNDISVHREECGIYLSSMAGFRMWDAVRVAFLRSCQKLPPHPIESTPTSSRKDLFLAKVKPISGDSTASGIIQLGRGEKSLDLLHKCNLERKVKIHEGQLCRHPGDLRGKGMLQVSEVPLQPMEVHRVVQQFVEEYWYHTGTDGCPKEAVTPWKATLEQAPQRREKPLLEQVL